MVNLTYHVIYHLYGMRAKHLKGWLTASNRGLKGGGEVRREGRGVGGRRETLGKTCGPDPDGVSRGGDGGRGYLVDRGVAPKEDKVVQGNWASGVDVEGRGGNLTSPAHDRHHLPRLRTWFSGGSRYRDSHPRGQAATPACSHKGGGPVGDLPRPDR